MARLSAIERAADVSRLARNILRAERASRSILTPHGRAVALAWYRIERARLEVIAAEIRDERALPVEALRADTVIAAAAVLSPATSWHALVVDLPGFILAALDGDPRPAFATYGRQRALAARIIRERLGIESATGPKVHAFARALSGDPRAVVVDRHAARIAEGVDGVNGRHAVPKALGDRIRAAYALAADRLGLDPAGLQALVWTARVGFGGEHGPVEPAGSPA